MSASLMFNNSGDGYDKGHYLRGMVWSSSGNFIGMLATAATVMVAVRILDKNEMGAYFLTMAVSSFIVVMGNWGLVSAAIRFLSRAEGLERDNLSNHFVTMRITFAALTCIALAIVLPFVFKLWPSEEFLAIGWYCIPIVFLMMMYQMGLALFSGYRMFGTMSILIAVVETVRMIVSLALLYYGYGPAGLLLSLIFTRIAAIVFIWQASPFRMRLSLRHAKGKEILQFGGWLQGSAVMSAVISRSADALLMTYLGTVALAVYSTALQIPAMMNKMFGTVRPVILGYLSSLKMKAANASVTAVRLLTGFLVLAAALIIVLARPMVTLFYSSKYLDSVPILQILSLWCVLGLVNYFLSLTLIGMGCVKVLFLLTIPQFLVMVICSIILIPKYQGVGAAISLALAAAVGNITEIWAVAGRDVRLYGRLNWAFFRSALPLLLLLVVMQTIEPPVTMAVGLLLVIMAVLYILKAITPEDIKRLYVHTLQKETV